MDLKNIGFSKSVRELVLRLCLAACVVVAGTALYSHPSLSQSDPKTPCDPEYMDALEARAWLEAQREITQNKNLIYKPDSVLEYSCFDKMLNEAASNFTGHRQFSETDRWDGRPQDFTDKTTDDALKEVVLLPLRTYLNSNFNRNGFNAGDYLNNRFDHDYRVPLKVDGGTSYSCEEMQQVWLYARCQNFIPKEEEKYDGFFDFAYYEKTDVRQESRDWALVCKTPDPRIADARKAAFNNRQDLFDVTDELGNKAEGDGKPYKEDDVVTHMDRILPDSGGNCQNNCVPTGICVERPDTNPKRYLEKVCPNPGCTFQPKGGC